MPSNKNQHFVPQFYLKNFSSDKRSISSFLIEAERLLPCVSIKNQCSKDYFYPDLKYEENLGKLEQQCRCVIQAIVSDRSHSFSRSDLFWLRAFTILQKSRTQHEAHIFKDIIEKTRDYMRSIGLDDKVMNTIDGFENSDKNAVILLSKTFGIGMEMTGDLHCKILSFVGSGSLLTSDDPVFMYNPFLETRGKPNYGLSAMGLILFLPLSDRHAVILYDGNVYKIGQKKKQVVEFDNPEDLMWLNLLTVLNADKTVFFKQGTQDLQSLIQLVRKAKSIGQSKEMKLEALEAEDGGSELIHSYTDNFYIGAGFSFVKILDKAKSIHFGDTIGVLDYTRPSCNTSSMYQGRPAGRIPSMTYKPKK